MIVNQIFKPEKSSS